MENHPQGSDVPKGNTSRLDPSFAEEAKKLMERAQAGGTKAKKKKGKGKLSSPTTNGGKEHASTEDTPVSPHPSMETPAPGIPATSAPLSASKDPKRRKVHTEAVRDYLANTNKLVENQRRGMEQQHQRFEDQNTQFIDLIRSAQESKHHEPTASAPREHPPPDSAQSPPVSSPAGQTCGTPRSSEPALSQTSVTPRTPKTPHEAVKSSDVDSPKPSPSSGSPTDPFEQIRRDGVSAANKESAAAAFVTACDYQRAGKLKQAQRLLQRCVNLYADDAYRAKLDEVVAQIAAESVQHSTDTPKSPTKQNKPKNQPPSPNSAPSSAKRKPTQNTQPENQGKTPETDSGAKSAGSESWRAGWLLRLRDFAARSLEDDFMAEYSRPVKRAAKLGITLFSIMVFSLGAYWESIVPVELIFIASHLLKRKRVHKVSQWLSAPSHGRLLAYVAITLFNVVVGGGTSYLGWKVTWFSVYQLVYTVWSGYFQFWALIAVICLAQTWYPGFSFFWSVFLYLGLSSGWWNVLGLPVILFLLLLSMQPLISSVSVYILRICWLYTPLYVAIPMTIALAIFFGMLLSAIAAANENAGKDDGQSHSQASNGSAYSPLKNVIPKGCTGPVLVVLQAGNYYQVLGVDASADEPTIKKAKRQLSLLTHPDKCSVPGAKEAFQLVTDAAEVLLNETSRKTYNREMQTANHSRSQRSNASRNQPSADGDVSDDMSFDIACGGHAHCARHTNLRCTRWCSDCNCTHPTMDGEMWAAVETVGFVLRRTRYYFNGNGIVYDVTGWATCRGLSAHLIPGEHIPYLPKTGRQQHQPPPRQTGNKKKQKQGKRR